MPLDPADFQRAALHEVSHAVIAVERGFFLHAVTMEGPNHRPGTIWRDFPDGVTVENNQDWARRELAVFAAGYLGELLFFPDNREDWVTGSDTSDKPMMDYCAVQHLEIEADINAINALEYPVSRHLWRANLPLLHWADYDQVIAEQVALVTPRLAGWEDEIRYLARMLHADGLLRGRVVFNVLGIAWRGVDRTGDWIEEEDF